jgi:hypothetical protein
MQLWFERFDGRGRHSEPVIDTDTGEKVGVVYSLGVGTDRNGGIYVDLFDGKYTANRIHKMDEAWGFVKGVEAVLRRVGQLLVHDSKQKRANAA